MVSRNIEHEDISGPRGPGELTTDNFLTEIPDYSSPFLPISPKNENLAPTSVILQF
jgi:hypothetical protein